MTAPENKPRDTVLVALDGSLAAATALPLALAVAAQLGADCEALHIVSDIGVSRISAAPLLRGSKRSPASSCGRTRSS